MCLSRFHLGDREFDGHSRQQHYPKDMLCTYCFFEGAFFLGPLKQHFYSSSSEDSIILRRVCVKTVIMCQEFGEGIWKLEVDSERILLRNEWLCCVGASVRKGSKSFERRGSRDLVIGVRSNSVSGVRSNSVSEANNNFVSAANNNNFVRGDFLVLNKAREGIT